MGANFYRRPIDENGMSFEVAGVDFSQHVMEYLGSLAEAGAEVWTAWVDVEDDASGDGYTAQVTPDICFTQISLLDDSADAVGLLDQRDGYHFIFQRVDHEQIFDWVLETVEPWAVNKHSLLPDKMLYEKALDRMTGDIASIDLLGLPPDVDGL